MQALKGIVPKIAIEYGNFNKNSVGAKWIDLLMAGDLGLVNVSKYYNGIVVRKNAPQRQI